MHCYVTPQTSIPHRHSSTSYVCILNHGLTYIHIGSTTGGGGEGEARGAMPPSHFFKTVVYRYIGITCMMNTGKFTLTVTRQAMRETIDSCHHTFNILDLLEALCSIGSIILVCQTWASDVTTPYPCIHVYITWVPPSPPLQNMFLYLLYGLQREWYFVKEQMVLHSLYLLLTTSKDFGKQQGSATP